MPNGIYNKGKYEILQGSVSVKTDTLKVMLINSGSVYSFDPDHNYVSEVTDSEFSGTYTRQTLTSASITQDDINNYAIFDAGDVLFSSVTGSISSMIVYKDSGSIDSMSPLLFYIDDNFPVTLSGGNLNINWASEGILAF